MFVLSVFGAILGIRLSDSGPKATLPANLPQFTREPPNRIELLSTVYKTAALPLS